MSCNQQVAILILGYFKLILIDLLDVGFECKALYSTVTYSRASGYGLPWPILAMTIASDALIAVDIIFSVLLLVAGHKRSRGALRVYFWYGIFGVIWTILRTGLIAGNNIATIMQAPPEIGNSVLRNPHVYVLILWTGLLSIVVQICLLVFVGRETKKLRNAMHTTATEEHKETELNNV